MVPPSGQVALDLHPRMLGNDRSALDVAIAHDDPLSVPICAIHLERLGDPAAGGDEERDQGAIAQLRLVDAESRLGGDPLELVGLGWLGEPFRQLGQVDGDAKVVSFNALTGYRSRPGGCIGLVSRPRQGWRRFQMASGGCELPPSGDWASGNPAFAMSRGSPARVPDI